MSPQRWQTTGQLLRDRPQVRVLPPGTGNAAITSMPPSAAPLRTRPPDPALQDLFEAIEEAAQHHGWIGQRTYNADGPDAGLHMTLVRGQTVLFAEVALTREVLTPGQQAWVTALQRTGQVEAYAWTPAEWPQIRERLQRAREAP